VAEDAEASFEEAALDAVPFHVLRGEEAHERLRHRKSDDAHGAAGEGTDASRASTSAGVGMASAQARREATMAPGPALEQGGRAAGEVDNLDTPASPPVGSHQVGDHRNKRTSF
jgi:hypothetical protein